jgi:hypothetical protein
LLALRHQILVLQRQRSGRRVALRPTDRWLWLTLSQLWSRWCGALILVKPETVIAWHRRGFRWFWRWKSRTQSPGRPAVSREIVGLIRTMHNANPTWGAPRIHGELLKLGIQLAESTVSKYLPPRPKRPPSQGWRTFLGNHLSEIIAVDFAVVPTVRGQLLFAFVVLSLARRRVLHVNVTAHPTAAWTAQQMVEALPWAPSARYVIRDRDGIYGEVFQGRVERLGLGLSGARGLFLPLPEGLQRLFPTSLQLGCHQPVLRVYEDANCCGSSAATQNITTEAGRISRSGRIHPSPVCPRPRRWQHRGRLRGRRAPHRYERRAAA